MFPPPEMLAQVPAVCLCGWRGQASDAVQRPSGLLTCPQCSRLVERQIPRFTPPPRPAYVTKG